MGIEKIAGEYIQEMTEPSGWPDIDENILFARANELLELRNAVSAAVDQWNREYSSIFESGSWRGSGAEAGGSSIQTSLRAMSQLQNHLAKGYAYYNMVAGLVAQAKTTINQNLQSAQEMIQTIRETPGLDEQSKEEIIRGYVLSQRGLNASVVVSGASQVRAFGQWTPPIYAIPPVAPPPIGAPRVSPPEQPSVVNVIPDSPVNASPMKNASYVSSRRGNDNSLPQADSATPLSPQRADLAQSQSSHSLTPTPSPTASTVGGQGSGSAPTGTATSTSSGSSNSSGSYSSKGSPPSASNDATAAPTTSGGNGERSSTSAASRDSARGGQTTTSAPSVRNPPSSSLTSPAPAAPHSSTSAPTSQSAAVSSSGGSSPPASGGASGAAPSGTAPVGAAPVGGSTAAPPPVPLGPPTTPAPAAPPPAGTAPAVAGPGVAPMSAASASGAAAAPAPVPVSTARAERDAILAASTPGGRRKAGDGDPLQRARHIGAALNVGVMDFGFFWVTGVTADGTIVVANSYGLAYIPDGVHLPEHVKMATADESITPAERATWATYPILAVQGWCRHHDMQLRAVVATEEQFANFDPGVAKIVLTADDIPGDGTMNGRSRLEAIAPDAAQRLIAVADTGLLNCTDKDTVTASGPTATVEVPLNGAPSAHRRLHPKRATAAGCRSRRAAVNEVLQKGNELLRPR